MALLSLSHVEHVRSVRSSDIIGFYLTVTALLRSAVVRTYWFLDDDGFHAIASLSLASLLIQLVILALESWSKRPWLIDAAGRGSPEECASFLSRSLFAWVNRLFFIGYRRQLTESDLRIVDSSLKTSELAPSFNKLLATKKCNSEWGFLFFCVCFKGITWF